MYQVFIGSSMIVLAVVVTMAHSLPTLIGDQPVKIVTENSESSGEGQQVVSSPRPTADYIANNPFQKLMNDNKKLAEYTISALSQTSLSSLQGLVNLYQGTTEQESMAFCNSTIKSALNGSMTISNDGCNFTVHCTYNPNRFPSLLLSGVCETLERPCMTYPLIKKCITHDIRVLVLYYETHKTSGYQIDTSDKTNAAAPSLISSSKSEWVQGRETIVTDCQCEN